MFWLVSAAFLAGFVDALVGGGGLIQIPALFTAFPRELPATLLGTNKLSAFGGTLFAATRYLRQVHLPMLHLYMLSNTRNQYFTS